jgi:hypothetical protein
MTADYQGPNLSTGVAGIEGLLHFGGCACFECTVLQWVGVWFLHTALKKLKRTCNERASEQRWNMDMLVEMWASASCILAATALACPVCQA